MLTYATIMKLTSIARSEWDFSAIKAGQERAAWEWEIDRTAFNKGKPWLLLDKTKQKEIAKYFDAVNHVKEHTLGDKEYDSIIQRKTIYERTTLRLHLLEIDWSLSQTAIKRELADWVNKQLETEAMSFLHTQKNRGGRPKSYCGLLVDLAIYRLKNADMKQKEMLPAMKPISEWAKLMKSPDNKLSPQHWSTAYKRMEQMVASRRERKFHIQQIF